MNTRKYVIDGVTYGFNTEAFAHSIDTYVRSNKLTKEKTYEAIGEYVHCSPDAVKNWKKSRNAPQEFEIVKRLAEFFKVDVSCFLIVKENDDMGKLTDLQLMSVSRVYGEIIDYLDYYGETAGFEYGYEPYDINMADEQYYDKLAVIVYDKINSFSRLLRKEYLFLHDTPVYNELYDFINSYLLEMFDDTNSKQYEIDVNGADFGNFAEEYYINSIKKLHDILTK